jgi:phospholipase/carboxylesterase
MHDGDRQAPGDALGFLHRYAPPTAPTPVTLLLLHGTGGDENDLLPLGRALAEGAALLSPRGKVLEGGAPRFFRRLAEGVFDQEDLAAHTDELAGFVDDAVKTYGIDRDRLVAVGFSNGANIAASLLLRRPGVVPAAVLLSPMVPFEPRDAPDLSGTSVLVGSGRADPIAPPGEVDRLVDILRGAGAEVTVYRDEGGHGVTQREVVEARDWIARTMQGREA